MYINWLQVANFNLNLVENTGLMPFVPLAQAAR